MKRVLAFGVILAAFAFGEAMSAPVAEVTRAQYGDRWPFPGAERATIRCERRTFGGVSRPLVTVVLGGRAYGLNGAAMGVGGYPDARTRMKRHPQWGTYELGATDEFIRMGLKLCP